ncbi:MAG: hypothetical protein IT273_08250 [Chitinophagales bacterium]|nr:hypothetical protein [Chitinophagales bacterium]
MNINPILSSIQPLLLQATDSAAVARGINSLNDLCVIALAGAFGGLVYSLQNNVMTFPHRDGDHRINLGFLANILFGIAGAIVIFLIVPGDFMFDYRAGFTSSDFIKSIATAILGGYGGLALVNSVFNKSLTGEIRNEIQQGLNNQKVIDEEVLSATDNLLSIGSAPDMTDREFSAKLKNASPATRMVVMNMAKQVRTENWRDNKAQMERSIPVFNALAESENVESHRALGQLAFALKERAVPDYAGALDNLSKAISLRNKESATGFALYEFNRAVCLINLDGGFKNNQASDTNAQNNIIADLRIAFADLQLNDRLQRNAKERGDRDIITIRKWLIVNRLSADSISPNLKWIDSI